MHLLLTTVSSPSKALPKQEEETTHPVPAAFATPLDAGPTLINTIPSMSTIEVTQDAHAAEHIPHSLCNPTLPNSQWRP